MFEGTSRGPNWELELVGKKTKHGTVVPCFADSCFDQLPGRSLSLLKRRASCRGACTRCAVTDHTRLVREKHALTGRANRDRGPSDGVADGRRVAVSRQSEHIAALRAACKNCVEQASCRRNGRARRCTAQSRQSCREAGVRVGGR